MKSQLKKANKKIRKSIKSLRNKCDDDSCQAVKERLGKVFKTLQKIAAHRITKILIALVITAIPTIWFYKTEIFPAYFPPPMSGEFNIAIANFIVVDENGKRINSSDGEEIALFLYDHLTANITQDIPFTVEIRGPGQMPKISGRNDQERQASVAQIASDINANIVVYGVINQGEKSFLTPSFYVNQQGFEQAIEITGPYALGSPILVDLPFNRTAIQDIENPALSARTQALNLITIGLAYYSVDNFDVAVSYFSEASEISGWFDNAGKEIAYMLIGNAYSRIVSIKQEIAYLKLASIAYEKSIEINPSYARAYVGKAGIRYIEALGNPDSSEFGVVDIDLLDEAERLYAYSLDVSDVPQNAYLDIKTQFSLGQIYIVKSQVLSDPDFLEKAETAFQYVVDSYQNGNAPIQDFASHAFARLGLINRMNSNTAEAIKYYEKAIEIASPYYKGFYSASLAEIYIADDKIEEAIILYDNAIQNAEFYGDEESAYKYLSRKNELISSEP